MTSDLTVTATYCRSVVYDLANGNSTTALWVQQLDAVGKGIYTYDPIQSVRESTTDQYANGVIHCRSTSNISRTRARHNGTADMF